MSEVPEGEQPTPREVIRKKSFLELPDEERKKAIPRPHSPFKIGEMVMVQRKNDNPDVTQRYMEEGWYYFGMDRGHPNNVLVRKDNLLKSVPLEDLADWNGFSYREWVSGQVVLKEPPEEETP